MKKIIGAMVVLLSVSGLFVSAQTRNGLVLTDTQAAINFMYANGLTKFNTATSFMAHNNLRRDEAAAFFVRFAKDILGMIPDTNKTECSNFSDLSQGHGDLQGEMIASCQLGLFKGSNGKFMPTSSFTNAQAIAVLIRLIDGDKSENTSHWAENYWLTAINKNLLEGLTARNHNNLDKNITRGEVARLIEAGRHYNGGYFADTGDEGNDIDLDLINNILDMVSQHTNDTTEKTEELAQCLRDKGVVMYGTNRCPHCQDQKERFGDSADLITFIDCDENLIQCQEAGIQGFPTWITQDGQKYTGDQPLESLAQIGACEL